MKLNNEIKIGLFVTALVFELWHLPTLLLLQRHSSVVALTIVILSFPVAVLFGYIAQRSNNMFGSTIFHVCYDLPLVLAA